jgi:protein TonB
MLAANKNSINGFSISFVLHVLAVYALFYAAETKSDFVKESAQKVISISLGSFEVPQEVVQKIEKPKPIEKKAEAPKKAVVKKPAVEKKKPKIAEPKKIEQKIEAVEPVKVAEAKPLQDDSTQEKFEVKEEPVEKNAAQSVEVLQEEYEKTNFQSIRDMVLANLKYPNNARRMGLHGTVELVLVIDTNGKLLDVILQKSSGHALLDKSALKSADKLCKKTLPAPQRVSRVTLPIYFALN